jgi:hypothetical protein
MMGGYREDPEDEFRRTNARRETLVVIAVLGTTMVGLELAEDALVASLELTPSRYKGLRILFLVLVMVVLRLFLNRRYQRPTHSSD